MNFNEGVGIDQCDRARRVSGKMKLEAIAVKGLSIIKDTTPPKVIDEVDHEATEHSSTTRTFGESNEKRCNFGRTLSILCKSSFHEGFQSSRHHKVSFLLVRYVVILICEGWIWNRSKDKKLF